MTARSETTGCGWHGPYLETVGYPLCERCGYPGPDSDPRQQPWWRRVALRWCQRAVVKLRAVEPGTGR